jgi:phosphoribosylglycinamide formyltransferase-1
MYGHHVHQAVIDNQEKESGITIHFVDAHYDNGDIIFQEKCEVLPADTADSLASRIHQLEYKNYPRVIENLAKILK